MKANENYLLKQLREKKNAPMQNAAVDTKELAGGPTDGVGFGMQTITLYIEIGDGKEAGGSGDIEVFVTYMDDSGHTLKRQYVTAPSWWRDWSRGETYEFQFDMDLDAKWDRVKAMEVAHQGTDGIRVNSVWVSGTMASDIKQGLANKTWYCKVSLDAAKSWVWARKKVEFFDSDGQQILGASVSSDEDVDEARRHFEIGFQQTLGAQAFIGEAGSSPENGIRWSIEDEVLHFSIPPALTLNAASAQYFFANPAMTIHPNNILNTDVENNVFTKPPAELYASIAGELVTDAGSVHLLVGAGEGGTWWVASEMLVCPSGTNRGRFVETPFFVNVVDSQAMLVTFDEDAV